MRNQLSRLTIVLMMSLFFATAAYAQHGSHLLIKANKASLEKRYDEAIRYYTQYIKLNPKDFRGYFNRGTTEYNAGKHKDGISDFSQCLTLNPIYKEAYYYRAKCKEAMKKHSAALKDYNHVLAKDSNNIAFLKARSDCHVSLKDYKSALKDLNKAATVNRLDGHIYKMRALVKIELNDLFGAVQDYDIVEALLPKYKMVHYLKGNLFYQLEMMDEACEEWHLAVEHGIAVAERNHDKYCHE